MNFDGRVHNVQTVVSCQPLDLGAAFRRHRDQAEHIQRLWGVHAAHAPPILKGETTAREDVLPNHQICLIVQHGRN